MRRIFAIGAMCCVIAANGTALAAQMDPRTIVSGFTLANIMSAAQAVNYQAEAIADSQGNRAVGITASNGVKFIVQPVACQQSTEGGCLGITIFGIFSGGNPSLQAANYFNGQFSFTKVFLAEDKALLERYEIADYGIPFGNIASNLTNFASIAEQFQKFLSSGSAGVSYTPEPDKHIVGSAFGGIPKKLEINESEFKLTPKQKGYINTIKP